MSTDKKPVGEALARAIVRLDAHEHCDVTVFDGVARFDPVLVGPPGRLHGGLHLAARTLTVLDALERHGPGTRGPVQIDVSLGKAIPLDTEVVFDGALVAHDGAFTLETRFLESNRLKATARSLDAYAPPERFDRARIERELASPGRKIRIFDMPFVLTPSYVYVDVPTVQDPPMAELAQYAESNANVGAPFVCAALDTVAAVGLGILWDNHLFTTHALVTMDTLPIAANDPLIVIAMLAEATAVENSGFTSVRVGERELVTTRVPVVLAKRAGLVPVAHGIFELHPVDPARFSAGALAPRESEVVEEP